MNKLPLNPIKDKFENACFRKPFERIGSGLFFQVLNYETEYRIWETNKWSDGKWKFSMQSPLEGYETPCLKNGTTSKHFFPRSAPFGNSPFWISDVNTGSIYLIDTENQVAEKYDGTENDFIRQRKLELR